MSSLSLLLRLLATVRNWPTFLLSKFGFVRGNVTYKLRSGISVTQRSYAIDGFAVGEVWIEHCYDPNAFGISYDWLPAKNIVEVGGHIGTFTLFAATMSPHARVIVLEPDPANFAMLGDNIKKNDLTSRITPLNVGLGTGEPVTLFTFPNDRGGNSVYRTNEGGTPVTIPTVSLHDLFQKHRIDVCDYLKLDCEGAEYEGLYSLSDEDLARIRCIGMEYHHFSQDPKHRSEPLQTFLESKGFRVIRHRKSMIFATR